MRSSGSVRTSSSRPPVKCLRSSMQNEGGVCGFSNVSFVRHARAEPLRAERNRRGLSVRVRRLSTTSSRVGSNILSILASASAADSSFAHSARAAASKAIVFSFFHPGQSISSRTRPAAVSPARYRSRRRYFTKHTAPAHTALGKTPKKSISIPAASIFFRSLSIGRNRRSSGARLFLAYYSLLSIITLYNITQAVKDRLCVPKNLMYAGRPRLRPRGRVKSSDAPAKRPRFPVVKNKGKGPHPQRCAVHAGPGTLRRSGAPARRQWLSPWQNASRPPA